MRFSILRRWAIALLGIGSLSNFKQQPQGPVLMRAAQSAPAFCRQNAMLASSDAASAFSCSILAFHCVSNSGNRTQSSSEQQRGNRHVTLLRFLLKLQLFHGAASNVKPFRSIFRISFCHFITPTKQIVRTKQVFVKQHFPAVQPRDTRSSAADALRTPAPLFAGRCGSAFSARASCAASARLKA